MLGQVMTKGVLGVKDILKLEQKIVPEIVEMLEKRYSILRTIYYNQPVGRRILASNLEMGERVVRTEINFLKQQNLIEINTSGMNITPEGEEIIHKLKEFIHELKGLSEIENILKEKLKVKSIIVVPGNMDEDATVMSEIGRTAAAYLRTVIKDDSIIAITGGSSVKEVIDNVSKISGVKNVIVVPARGGMGRNVETQANTLAANLANKIGAGYKLLHVPDNLSNKAINTIISEKDIKEVLEIIHKANILIYGIGRADEMGRRRGLTQDELNKILNIGAVGEAFGYYFDRNGNTVYSSPTIGLKSDQITNVESPIAVAAGKNKAEAILSMQFHNTNSILITDEGAAREMLSLLS
jgi:central glycolytic genes regulator